jgi:hypothetical protein
VGPVVVVAAALVVGLSSRHATSWHFFRDAAHLLMAAGSSNGGGLDVYLAHPEFQFGPLAVIAAMPFALLPASLGVYAVLGFGTLLGAVAILGIEITARRTGARAGRGVWDGSRIAGELTLAIVWADVAVRTAHLDDAIALASVAIACAAVAHNRPGLATAALTIAAAAKPWAIVFAPLALVPPGRFKAARIGAVLAGVALTWLPFVADEPGSVAAAGSFTIANAPSSALRVLGFADPATPSWVRPTQVALGLLLAFALVRARRWPAVIMVGLALRLMLDPAVHHYYAAGLVLGTLLWESVVRPGRLPLLTVATAVILEVTPEDMHPSALAGVLRLALTAGLIVAAFWAHPRTSQNPWDAGLGRRRQPAGPDARVEVGREVLGQVAGVGGRAVDERRLAPAQEGHPHEVEPGEAGHAAIVDQPAAGVQHPQLQP